MAGFCHPFKRLRRLPSCRVLFLSASTTRRAWHCNISLYIHLSETGSGLLAALLAWHCIISLYIHLSEIGSRLLVALLAWLATWPLSLTPFAFPPCRAVGVSMCWLIEEIGGLRLHRSVAAFTLRGSKMRASKIDARQATSPASANYSPTVLYPPRLSTGTTCLGTLCSITLKSRKAVFLFQLSMLSCPCAHDSYRRH